MAAGRHPWLVPGIWAGGLVPVALLVGRAFAGTLPADPVAHVLHQLGLLSLVLLLASLSCTPLRLLSGQGWPISLRRPLGLLAFGHAALHGLFYVAVDQGMDLRVLIEDLASRPFILVGTAALLCLLPLASTSTAASIKWLGAKRWRRLHRLAYLAAGLGVAHFYMREKSDVTRPVVYGAVLALLLGVRAFDALWKRRPARA